MDLLPVDVQNPVGHEDLSAHAASLRDVIFAATGREEVGEPKGQVLSHLVFTHGLTKRFPVNRTNLFNESGKPRTNPASDG